MYKVHWGINRSPFPGWIDPECFYNGPGFQEALARLVFLVDNRRRLGLLTGRRGAGKSMIFEVLAQQLRKRGCQVAKIGMLGLNHNEFITNVADALDIHTTGEQSLVSLWRSVGDRLVTNRYQQIQTVILLDDADDAETDALTAILRLSNLDQSPNPFLTIVLSSGNDRCELLGQRLQDMCELRVDLESLNAEQTEAYIQSALANVGREAPAFQTKAIERLQELSGGVPRRIGQLAQLCLVAGAGQGLNQIEPETVEAAYRELSVMPELLVA